MSLKVVDLFSGIGGFSLGFEEAGMETVLFCENDIDCKKVLSKHWPKVPIWSDIKTLTGNRIKSICGDDISVLCGGFPCQDISVAGGKKGLKDEQTGKATRSGLWFEFKRIIKEVGPRYVVIENVANLRSKGLATIIKDLWQIGYVGEWNIISARSVGAPHLRERCWIIAYPCSKRLERQRQSCGVQAQQSTVNSNNAEFANTNNFRLWRSFASQKESSRWWSETTSCISHWEETQSIVCGVSDGVSRGMDRGRKQRIKQLGNAVVPQIPKLIGRAIMEFENECSTSKS